MITYLISGQYRDSKDDQWGEFSDLMIRSDITQPSAENLGTEVLRYYHDLRLKVTDIKVTDWIIFDDEVILNPYERDSAMNEKTPLIGSTRKRSCNLL